MERVLVLGGTGFVGRRVVAALSATDWAKPVAASRRTPLRRFGLKWRRCDVTKLGDVGALLGEFDMVVNCVSGSPHAIVKGCRNVFQAASMAGIRRVVHISSMAVYPRLSGEIDETTPIVSDGSGYSGAKAQAERLAADYKAAGGDVVILRPSCIYGPGSQDWTGRIGRLLRAGRLGDLGAAGDGVCNLINVDDLADAVVSALTRDGIAGETFNVSSPERMSWNAYLAALANAIGVEDFKTIHAPKLWAECYLVAPAVRLAALLTKPLTSRVVQWPDTVSPGLISEMQRPMWLSTRKADSLLAFQRTSLRDGMRGASAWFREKESLPSLYTGESRFATF